MLGGILGAGAAVGLALWIRHCLRRLRAGQRPAWVMVFVVVGLAQAALFCLDWSPSHRFSRLFEHLGFAVMLCAGVLLVRGVVEVVAERKRVVRRVVVTLCLTLLVLGVGNSIRWWPRAAHDGWWALVPSPVLVRFTESLPEEAVRSGGGSGGAAGEKWSLVARYRRDELSTKDARLLGAGLERRYRLTPSLLTLDALEDIDGLVDTESTGLDASFLEVTVARFLDSDDAAVRTRAAWDLDQCIPVNLKITHGDIGADHGARVLRGKVPRLIELIGCEERVVASTAVDLVSLCGDEALAAIPAMHAGCARDDFLIHETVKCLEYLAEDSPMVRERLVEMERGGAGQTWLLAVLALRHQGLDGGATRLRIIELLREDDAATVGLAMCAVRWVFGEENALWLPVLLEEVERDRPDRARLLDAYPSSGSGAVEYFPKVLRLLSDHSTAVRVAAVGVIERMVARGTPVNGASAELERLLKDSDPSVRRRAQAALEAIRARWGDAAEK